MDEDERDFWATLEYRVCRELEALPENHLRFYWCDGFVPREYLFDLSPPRIVGQAWIGGMGPGRQEQWKFTLLLDGKARSRSELEWSSLLPPENVTRWLLLDPLAKYLEIEPSVAVLDGT